MARKYSNSRSGRGIPASPPPSGDFVVYPDDRVAFILGPQLLSGSSSNPHPHFDEIAHDRGIFWGDHISTVMPAVSPAGTITVTNGSAVVVGVGTHFLTDIDQIRYAGFFDHIGLKTALAGSTHRFNYGGYPAPFVTWKVIASVTDDTHLTLSANYDGPTESGIGYTTVYDMYENPAGSNWNTDFYINHNYYDQVLVQYINYYRTGDSQFLTYARRFADSWWKGQAFASGNRGSGEGFSPRNSSTTGIILRALDGHPEYWDAITQYVDEKFQEWVLRYVDSAPELAYGVRDGSYMLLFATQLAKCLPDSYPAQAGGTITNGAARRAQYLADAENAAVNYYGRLQYPDGSYRFSIDDFNWFPPPDTGIFQITQVFQVGLLLQALGDLYFLSTNPTVKASIKAQIEDCVVNIHTNGPFINAVVGGKDVLGYEYLYYGSSSLIPNAFDFVAGPGGHPGGIGPGTPTNAPLATDSDIQERRSLGQTLLHAYGLAYYISGNAQYKTWGDAVYRGQHGKSTDTPAGDNLFNFAAGDVKSYNESYRSQGRYLAFRLMV